MKAETISRGQLKALQSLWSAHARHSLDAGDGDPRAARLAWACEQAGRAITSFNELSAEEALVLIDRLKAACGQPIKSRWRRPRDRRSARALGTHGRRSVTVMVPVMASAEDLALIDELRDAVGMTAEGFASWLSSRHSPVRGGVIRTLADANRVIWGLKNMRRRLLRAG